MLSNRTDAMQKVATALAGLSSPTVIVTAANSGYSVFLNNWLGSLKRIGRFHEAVIFALDAKLFAQLRAAGVRAADWSVGDSEAFVPHLRPGWQQIVFAKLSAVRAVLATGRNAILSDADIVFRRDPLPYLEASTGKRDLSIQADDGRMVCAGFYFIRPTRRSLRLVDTNAADIERGALVPPAHVPGGERVLCDQPLINRRLATWAYPRSRLWPMANFRRLPRELFPNGNAWRQGLAADPYLVHFNCTVGMDNKIAFMREAGMWCPQQE